jgi:hypothetical protein
VYVRVLAGPFCLRSIAFRRKKKKKNLCPKNVPEKHLVHRPNHNPNCLVMQPNKKRAARKTASLQKARRQPHLATAPQNAFPPRVHTTGSEPAKHAGMLSTSRRDGGVRAVGVARWRYALCGAVARCGWRRAFSGLPFFRAARFLFGCTTKYKSTTIGKSVPDRIFARFAQRTAFFSGQFPIIFRAQNPYLNL